jgi:hypothetical protein
MLWIFFRHLENLNIKETKDSVKEFSLLELQYYRPHSHLIDLKFNLRVLTFQFKFRTVRLIRPFCKFKDQWGEIELAINKFFNEF